MSNLANTKRNNNVLKFDPFVSVFDDFFNHRYPTTKSSQKEFSLPKVNITESDKAYTIDVAAPGLEKSDFDITIEENVLAIASEKKEAQKEEGKKLTRKEFSYATFKRTFALPESIDEQNINANYTNGILKVTLPKKEVIIHKLSKKIAVT